MENTKIEWATHTFNPWEGCAKVSPGCKNCYAEGQHKLHHAALGKNEQQGTCWGIAAPRLGKSADNWKKPLRWNRAAGIAGIRARVFCASMADVFEPQSPLSAAFAGQTAQVPTGGGKTRTVTFVDLATERLRLLRLIYDTPHLDWLLLTKRPEHIEQALYEAWTAAIGQPGLVKLGRKVDLLVPAPAGAAFCNWLGLWVGGTPPANVWLGTSVENQEQADIRVPQLLAAPAAVRFLSCEPLLSGVDLKAAGAFGTWVPPGHQSFAGRYDGVRVDWVIVGGESGHKARPMHPDWVRGLRDQCQAAGVAFHFKQWGEWYEGSQHLINCPAQNRSIPIVARLGYKHLEFEGLHLWRFGKHEAGRHLDGRTWDEVPTPQPVAP